MDVECSTDFLMFYSLLSVRRPSPEEWKDTEKETQDWIRKGGPLREEYTFTEWSRVYGFDHARVYWTSGHTIVLLFCCINSSARMQSTSCLLTYYLILLEEKSEKVAVLCVRFCAKSFAIPSRTQPKMWWNCTATEVESMFSEFCLLVSKPELEWHVLENSRSGHFSTGSLIFRRHDVMDSSGHIKECVAGRERWRVYR